jgi:hypothetical protein
MIKLLRDLSCPNTLDYNKGLRAGGRQTSRARRQA